MKKLYRKIIISIFSFVIMLSALKIKKPSFLNQIKETPKIKG